MKRIKSLILLLAFAASIPGVFAKNIWTLDGKEYEVDTLIYRHQVGPGVQFAKYDLPSMPLKVSVLEVDYQNEYFEWETCKGGDRGVCEEQPTQMYARSDREGHNMIAATNGDFYFFKDPKENGIPRSGQFRLNECVTNPVGRAAIVTNDAKELFIDYIDFKGRITVNGETKRLHTVNMQRLEWETVGPDQLNLYTNSYGTQTENCIGGAKVIISPKEGSFFWSANKDIVAVVDDIVPGNGVTEIPAGKAILWGRGSYETLLNGLSAGTEITINLQTDMRNKPGYLKDFKELMGGSNHIILKNGEMYDTSSDRHPRTFMGFSKDKKTLFFVLADGRSGESIGTSMQESGAILKELGAWEGVNLDGGGSSVMIVNGDIVNKPSDGNVRPVGNGNLLVSKAPASEVVEQLGFAPRSYNVLTNARFRPVIYGYNKYGLLKTKDLEGVTFTCDEAIGHIEGNEFVAADKPARGMLTAHFGDFKESVEVTIFTCATKFALDSVVVDDTHPYMIEIVGENGVYHDNIDPRTVTWTVEDPSICKVVDGQVVALATGETTISGKSNVFEQSLKVRVHIPKYKVECAPELKDINGWKVSASGVKDRVVTAGEDGLVIKFKGAPGRSNYIKIEKDFIFSGLPEKLQFKLKPGDIDITKINFVMRSPIQQSIIHKIDFVANPDADGCTLIEFKDSDLIGEWKQGHFPLNFLSMHMTMSRPVKDKEYVLSIPEINAVYAGGASVENVLAESKALKLYPNPVEAGEPVTLEGLAAEGTVEIEIVNMNGAVVRAFDAAVHSGAVRFLTEGLSAGIYAVKAGKESCMIVVK